MKKMDRITEIIRRVKVLAQEYYSLTGKPIGITGEVAEVEAARLLGLELAEARQPGYDAIRRTGNENIRIQIKGRRITKASKSGRLSKIDRGGAFDTVILVLVDEEFEPFEIHEATKHDVVDALMKPGSKARNEKGQLSVSQFKAISSIVWMRKESN